MMNLFWKIFIGLFILDVFKRQFEKPRGKEVKTEETKANIPPREYQESKDKEEEIPDNIDTSLEEDEKEEEIETEKSKPKTKPKNKDKSGNDDADDDDDDEDDEEEDDKPKKKKTKKIKKKKTKKKNVEKKTITISYCKTTQQKYFDQFKLEMMGNFTNYEFVGVEHPVSPQKEFFSKFTFFSQIGVSLLIFGGSRIKQFLPFIPSVVFDQIEKNKWMVMIGNYFLHSYLKSYLASSYAFEVSIEGISLWSKLATNILPKVEDIGRILKAKGL